MSSSSRSSSPEQQVINEFFKGIKFKLVSAKIRAEDLHRLVTLIELHGGQTVLDVATADVIITAVRTRIRLERHVHWDLAKTKAVVSPQWVEDSLDQEKFMPVMDYIPVVELKSECAIAVRRGKKPQSLVLPNSKEYTSTPNISDQYPSISGAGPTVHSTTTTAYTAPRYVSSYACQRHSPLVCPNQDLVEELIIIKKAREVDGDSRSALSYARAISALKALPYEIKSLEGVDSVPHIGPKTQGMISQFLRTGKITHAEEIRSSTRYQCLMSFTTIYGIGPTTAQKLYDLGLRTLRDLEIYADVDDLDDGQLAIPIPKGAGLSHGAKRLTWPEGLKIREDLETKISRPEVEEIAQRVQEELNAIMPGSDLTICGGYRRGKIESNDIDLVFTHPEGPGQERLASDLATKLTKRLLQAGLITHAMHLPSFRNREGIHPRPMNRQGWDKLEKVMTVMKFPPKHRDDVRRHRRVDLVYSPRDVYWCAIVGWTGSTQFERDLRLWAKRKMHMKFDSSGITRLRDTESIYVNSEREVFDVLGLEWIDPTLRNAG